MREKPAVVSAELLSPSHGWDPLLLTICRAPHFDDLSWHEVLAHLQEVELTKYSDFNLLNIVKGSTEKNTFEIRILPSTLDEMEVVMNIELFEALLRSVIQEIDLITLPDHNTCAESVETRLAPTRLIERLFQYRLLTERQVTYWRRKCL